MIVFKVKIAGIIIEIHSYCSLIRKICREYAIATNEEPALDIMINNEMLVEELENILVDNMVQKTNRGTVYNESLLESDLIFKKIADNMIKFDTILLHGAVVAKDNNGYMFMAKSGVGKSTRAKLWMEEFPDSYVVNGDKPFVKIMDTVCWAYGTPWCGKEGWNTNTEIPLRVIFLLERADSEEDNFIQQISLTEAFPMLLNHTYYPSNPMLMVKTVELLKKIDKSVKIFKFRSTPSRKSMRIAYEKVKL